MICSLLVFLGFDPKEHYPDLKKNKGKKRKKSPANKYDAHNTKLCKI